MLQVQERAPEFIGLSSSPELTIIVPTLNERGNVGVLVDRLSTVLQGHKWEIIFVDDDSPDGTADIVREIAMRDPHVRCLQRIGRRGLAGACIEGMLASCAPYLAIMDADLQHDENILPQMLRLLRDEGRDLVVGSRYLQGGSVGSWVKHRQHASSVATRLAQFVASANITDPMSGFFMIRRAAFEQTVHSLSKQGFKILFDILASSREPLAIAEIPYRFRQRVFGESKIDLTVAWEFLMLLADKLIGHIIPVRFALFALIGGAGVLVHLFILALGLTVLRLPFVTAQTAAVGIAMTANYCFNNFITYADQRLRGWRFLRGLMTFYLVCSVGAAANIGIASYLFHQEHTWWLAGVAGVVMGSVWNYAVSSVVTWKNH